MKCWTDELEITFAPMSWLRRVVLRFAMWGMGWSGKRKKKVKVWRGSLADLDSIGDYDLLQFDDGQGRFLEKDEWDPVALRLSRHFVNVTGCIVIEDEW